MVAVKQIKTITIVVNYPSTCDNILSATTHMQSNTKIQTIKIYFTSAICFGWTILEFSTQILTKKVYANLFTFTFQENGIFQKLCTGICKE